MNKRTVGIVVAVVIALGGLVYWGLKYRADQKTKQQQEQAEKAARAAELAARKEAEKQARLLREKSLKNLHLARQFADSVGIDTIRYVARPTASQAQLDTLLMRLLTEVRYGKKPSGLAYVGMKDKIDSAWIRNVDAALAPESKTNLSAFLPYQQLIEQYNKLGRRKKKNLERDDTLRLIRQTLNFYRYVNRFDTEQFIVVNLPTGQLNVFNQTGERLLSMQVIAGKPASETPRMTTYIQNIVMYPQWNVPKNIVLDEMLPRMKRSLGYLSSQNLELLDDRGRVVDPEKVNWKTVSVINFPYRVRQASGCENALGLLKFNLANPLAIYLHDTNSRDLFKSKSSDQWRSHGCVRVQKPVELANLIIGDEVFDDKFMNECLLNQKPQTLSIPKRIPVFITYNLADIDEKGQLRIYKDIYQTLD